MHLLRPVASTLLIGAVTDLTRSKADLIAENALLRHRLTLLKRQSKRPFHSIARPFVRDILVEHPGRYACCLHNSSLTRRDALSCSCQATL